MYIERTNNIRPGTTPMFSNEDLWRSLRIPLKITDPVDGNMTRCSAIHELKTIMNKSEELLSNRNDMKNVRKLKLNNKLSHNSGM